MREKRNAILVLLLFLTAAWGFYVWFVEPEVAARAIQRLVSVIAVVVCGGLLVWSFYFEDKLPDSLARFTGGIYYEQDGLCFMPVMRKKEDQAFICIYFENRYENPCNAVVHLRPPKESVQHRPDATDIHFAFSCPGGAVGVIHQPVAVHPRLQGQVIDVDMAAAVNYPHNRGEVLRSHRGLKCGTFKVDWGSQFRTGMHELSSEIELLNPVSIHLSMPREVSNRITRNQQWRQEMLSTSA